VYDVIVGLDDHSVSTDDQLIREIAGRAPGTSARVRFVRQGHELTVMLKLEERPPRDPEERDSQPAAPERRAEQTPLLGLNVRDLDRRALSRLAQRGVSSGVLILHVEPMSSSFDGGIERDSVLIEINRQKVETVADFKRIARAAHVGDVVVLHVYSPFLDQHQLKTVRVEDR
jgi:serine protease Do